MGSLVESYEKYEVEEYPPKVKAMYEAVLELFASGRELSTLKVSEITEKAGIGKGTAYEYFSTKEEIIVGALEYEAGRQMKIINNLIETNRKFREIIMTGFELMETALIKNRGFAMITQMVRGNTLAGENVLNELEKHKEGCNIAADMSKKVANLALEENLIKEKDEYKIQTAIISQVLGYAFFMTGMGSCRGTEKEQAKEIAYENILKLLN